MSDSADQIDQNILPHRCGVRPRKDSILTRLRRRFGIGPYQHAYNDDPICKWFHRPVTWKVGPITSDLSPEFIEKAISDALLSWSEVCNFQPDFRPTSGHTDLNFGFYTSRDRTVLRGNTAFAYFPCHRRSGDVYFNIGVKWTPELFELYVLHEVGHVIGLQDDTDNFLDVMQTTPDQASLIFSDIDKTRAQNLYKRGRHDDVIA